ncbi:MAG: hypothetical protein IKL90_04920 [Alphaproteobacteria bacterium]|nr:hypothetical protein [Alphaproteobacteria bacterium]
MNFFGGSMIAFEVLLKMNKNPERFDFSHRAGWQNLLALTIDITTKNTKSLKGAFEQASLIGFCIASEWNQKNKAFMNQDEYKSVSNLLQIYNFLSQKKLVAVREFKAETKMNAEILKGFHHGYKLALVYSKHQQRSLDSAEKHNLTYSKTKIYVSKRVLCRKKQHQNG